MLKISFLMINFFLINSQIFIITVMKIVQKITHIMMWLFIIQFWKRQKTLVWWCWYNIDRLFKVLNWSDVLFLVSINFAYQILNVIRRLLLWMVVLSLNLCLTFILYHFQWDLSFLFFLFWPLLIAWKWRVCTLLFTECFKHILKLLRQYEWLPITIFCLTKK
mgnify:CR=1 FL=1